jgi:hypothetical protein
VITPRQLLQVVVDTQPKLLRKAQQCTVIETTKSLDRDTNGVFSKTLSHVIHRPPDGSGRPHLVQIRLYLQLGKLAPDHIIWIECDCGYHRYVSEVALFAQGAAAVIHSTGDYPRHNNPQMRPWPCKHALATIPIAIKSAPHVPKDPMDAQPRLRDLLIAQQLS